MIQKLTYITSSQTIPYHNLALEEYLLLHVEKRECILYLWQNRHTIVIGKNQNAWKECKINQLKQDGGYLVRRLSGGGAVFHDLGNLNFTFLVRQEDYNLDKQLQVILLAVQKSGIQAERTGRNDIIVNGKKFSGNAFYETQGHCYHHGTLMVHVNVQDLSKYLNVSVEKLKSKGVNSVKSRVANLADYDKSITVDQLKENLVEAFGEVYGLTPQSYTAETIDENEINLSENKFSSWNWIFGRKIEFNYEMSERFVWGDLTLQLTVNGGYIKDAVVYSDAMDQKLIGELPGVLTNIMFDKKKILMAVSNIQTKTEQNDSKMMLRDICRFIEEQDI